MRLIQALKFKLRFFGDPRNEDQKARYVELERRRADAYLAMHLARVARLQAQKALQKRCALLQQQAD